LLKEGIMPFWFLDQTFAESRGCGSCRYIVILFLCDQFAVVEQSSFGSWDPVRQMAYFTRCQWWVSVQTSSAMQFAFASSGSLFLGLCQSWCPLTHLTFNAIGSDSNSLWIPWSRS
jgi:hypothetical protein